MNIKGLDDFNYENVPSKTLSSYISPVQFRNKIIDNYKNIILEICKFKNGKKKQGVR